MGRLWKVSYFKQCRSQQAIQEDEEILHAKCLLKKEMGFIGLGRKNLENLDSVDSLNDKKYNKSKFMKKFSSR